MQEHTSEKTSLNQVPALFRRGVNWGSHKLGTRYNLDFGGGKYNKASDFLASKGIINWVYDPFNRTEAHNKSVLMDCFIRPPDSITLANVLNVIKEPEARAGVLRQCWQLMTLNPACPLFVAVHDGDRTGTGKKTTRGWQENRKARSYEPELAQFFNVTYHDGFFRCVLR